MDPETAINSYHWWCLVCILVFSTGKLQCCMSPDRSLASRQQKCCLGFLLYLLRLNALMLRLGLASVSILWPLSYVTISICITFTQPSFAYMCLRPLGQNFIYITLKLQVPIQANCKNSQKDYQEIAFLMLGRCYSMLQNYYYYLLLQLLL